MIDKIFDFYYDYEEFINFILISLFFLIVSQIIIYSFDKQSLIVKNIIEETKNYVIFDNCEKFENKYYCWEEIE